MNPDKTEAIVFSTSARKRMEGIVNTVDLGCVSVSPMSNVQSLGVTIVDTPSFNEHVDNVTIVDTPSFNEHVDNVCKSRNFHIRALRHIYQHISEDAAKTIACSMVNERLDYCNSLLHRSSFFNINKLQRVQNSQDDGYWTPSHQFLQISTGNQFSTAVIQYCSISLQL